MKKTFFQQYIVQAALLMAAGMAGSCKKLIEIPPNPPTEIVQSEPFADSSTAMTGVALVYSYVGQQTSSGFGYNDAKLPESTGLSSDEIIYTSTNIPDMTGFPGYGLTNLNSVVAQLWSDQYASLYPINAIIEGVSGSTGLSAGFKKQITAEMQVVRALYYFNLVNLFGGGPLSLSTDYNVTNKVARAFVDSVYGQILTDLTSATQKLSTDDPSG